MHTGRIVPIYEKAGSVTPRMQRTLVHRLLARAAGRAARSAAGADSRSARGLPDRRQAIVETHFPPPGTDVDALNACRTPAQQRLIFEEFFLFQAGLVLRKRRHAADRKARPVVVDDRIRESARRVLPFKLTDGQKTALREIVTDMQRPEPMNRLLQGDVGAGKTIVALLAAVVAMENGLQVAFMAPTEILADQHYLTIRRLLDASRFRVASLTGSVDGGAAPRGPGRARERRGPPRRRHARAGRGGRGVPRARARHHRRAASVRRACSARRCARRACNPDVLVMTATPIPRTLALTAYGDLDVSVIRDLPPGRQPIRDDREAGVAARGGLPAGAARARSGPAGRTSIYPLVEDSEKVDLRAATAMADHLQAEVFPEYTRRAAARPAEAGREGSRDGRVRARRRARARRRRRSSRSASTCRTRR